MAARYVTEYGRVFRFRFRLEGLAEAQALAVLAIAEGASPEAVALIDSYREVSRRIEAGENEKRKFAQERRTETG